MVHKRYVNKKGKRFGPYYYESYREEDKVKKRYIGGEKEYKEWLKNKKFKKNDVISKKKNILKRKKLFNRKFIFTDSLGFTRSKPLKPLVEQPVKIFSKDAGRKLNPSWSFNKKVSKNFNKKLLIFGILGIILMFIFIFGFSLTGYVVSENTEVFDSEIVDLEIKQPVEVLGQVVSENKNERMDFYLEQGGLRLDFDLLNYSEFVEKVADEIDSVVISNVTEKIEEDVVGDIINETVEEIDNNEDELVSNVSDEDELVSNVSDEE